LEDFTKIIRKFFWEGTAEKIKYYLVKWDLVCKPRGKGPADNFLKLSNYCLLYKWWWKLENEQALWQTLVKNRYGTHKRITRVGMKQNDSSMWKDLLNFKHLYLQGRIMMTDNGDAIDLWKES
jgi:hypothetical protein